MTPRLRCPTCDVTWEGEADRCWCCGRGGAVPDDGLRPLVADRRQTARPAGARTGARSPRADGLICRILCACGLRNVSERP